MNLAAIPAGSSVFVDANIFIYGLGGDRALGTASKDLLNRVERSEIRGFLSAPLLSSVAHRLMTLEACRLFGWSFSGVGRQLKRHPAEFAKLSLHLDAVIEIKRVGFEVLPVEYDDVLSAARISQQHGLLSNDALILALMQKNRLDILASNDADFDRVPGITRYSPA